MNYMMFCLGMLFFFNVKFKLTSGKKPFFCFLMHLNLRTQTKYCYLLDLKRGQLELRSAPFTVSRYVRVVSLHGANA